MAATQATGCRVRRSARSRHCPRPQARRRIGRSPACAVRARGALARDAEPVARKATRPTPAATRMAEQAGPAHKVGKHHRPRHARTGRPAAPTRLRVAHRRGWPHGAGRRSWRSPAFLRARALRRRCSPLLPVCSPTSRAGFLRICLRATAARAAPCATAPTPPRCPACGTPAPAIPPAAQNRWRSPAASVLRLPASTNRSPPSPCWTAHRMAAAQCSAKHGTLAAKARCGSWKRRVAATFGVPA